MEKFGTWADKASGIRPFIPLNTKIPLWKKILIFIFGPIKLFLIILNFITIYVNTLFISLIPIPIVSRFLNVINSYINVRVSLSLFGSFLTKIDCKPLINKVFAPESWETPDNGDIIFSPLTSYLDILWLQVKVSPIFAIPVDSTHVVTYKYYSLIYSILKHQDLRSGNCEEIQSVIEKAKKSHQGPVVVFAESAPSNGQGILKFVPMKFSVSEKTKVFLLAFLNQSEGPSPNFVCTDPIKHLIFMAGRFYAPIRAFAPLKKDLETIQPSKFGNEITPELIEKCREIHGKLLNIPLLQVDADTCRGFINAYTSQEESEHFKAE